ncbi:MAG TPA: hypothetical protein VLL05_10590 [Terriglobales bacterium]|jgi:hypothetical protein|nr:hypothetical protein [Terriglobales bacterium]
MSQLLEQIDSPPPRWLRLPQVLQSVLAPATTDAGLWQYDIPSRYLWRLILVSLLNLFSPFCLPATAADPARILIINAWEDTMPAARARNDGYQKSAC